MSDPPPDQLRAAVEEAVRTSEALTSAMLDTALDCIISIDHHGRIIEFNPAAERTLGHSRAAVLGRDLADVIVPPAMREGHRRGLAHYLATGEGPALDRRLELSALHADGHEFPVELTITRVSLPGPPIFTGYLRDITDRRRAEEELRRSEERARRLAEEQAALRRVATAVAREPEPATVLGLVAEEVAALLGVEAGLVVRFDGGAANPVGWWSRTGSRRPSAFPLVGGGALATAHREGRPCRMERDDLLGDDPVNRIDPRGAYRSSVAAPVEVGGETWGAVLAATTRSDAICAEAEERLAQFAELVGVAIANADARGRLADLAATDALTGLANHRTFHERLQAEERRARRYGRLLSLVVLDLDHFKRVNDLHGHQAGDRVLAEVGRCLAGLAREGELVARIGGEEFGWLLPEVDGMGAYAAAERARAAIARRPFGSVGTLTTSAGVCDLAFAASADELLQFADGALYWAKVHGRNATYRYSPEVIEPLSSEARAEQLERVQTLGALRALARAIDAKDPSTQSHSERVAEVARDLALVRGWPPGRAARLRDAALVHDVGKIGVPDAVLLKPGRLTSDEYALVKEHATRGADIASEVLGPEQVEWIRHHHERWDGRGYPDGLAGDAVPEGARLLALADAWDVMVSSRLYKAPRTPAEALEECRREAGSHFCPTSVAALLELWAAAASHPGARVRLDVEPAAS